MKRKLLLAVLCAVSALGGQLRAQTNIIAGWDGGSNTGSPSNFGWTSSTNRTLNARNASSGVRMTTTYSGYKDEGGNSYSYSSSSDPSSVIFWIRYGSNGESYTYTFKGLEPDYYYDFSGLVGWHNNSNAPTFTVTLNDGTNTLATMSKYVGTKQKLYSVSSRFKTPSTITNETDIKIVFTCNQTGDCMEAVSAMSLVNVVVKDDLQAAISYANRVNNTLNNSTLASSITTAQGVYDNASATQAQVYSATSTLNTAAATALGDAAPTDMSFVINNPGFESSTAISANQGTGSSQNYASTGWTALSTSTSNSCGAVVAYGSSFTLNNVNAPSADNNSASGNALGISIGWSATVAYQSSAVTLPAGSYTMTVYGYNNNPDGSNFTSKNGFITSSNSYLSTKTSFTNGTWETDVITFSLTEQTTGVFQIGGTAGNNTSTSHAKVFFDNISISYENPMQGAITAWNTAHNTLSALEATALPDAAENAITTELAKARPNTQSELETATAALQALIDSYDGIKAAYDKVNDFITFVTAEKTNSTGTKTEIEAAINTATSDIENRTTAAALEDDYNTLETARQTYVTSGAQPTEGHVFDYTFKISNPSFEEDGQRTDAPTGWNIPSKGADYGARPLGESGSTYFMSNADGSYVFNNWQSWWMTCQVSQEITSLPNGHYSLTAVVAGYDKSTTTLKANETATNQVTTGAANGILVTVNETIKDGNLTILAQSAGTSGQTFLKVDDFHLYYKGNAVDDATVNALIATMVEGKMNAEVASAQETAKNNLLDNKTIDNYTALETAIAAASESKDAYTQLKAELDKVPGGLGTTNVYTATSYATNYADVLTAYTAGTISTDDAKAYAFGDHRSGAIPAIMLSSWKVDETAALETKNDVLYMNTWSTEGNSDGSEMTTPFYEYYGNNANALDAKTFTATVEGLTSGTNYMVTAKVRVRQQDSQEKADDDVTVQVNDGDVVNAADGTQSSVRTEMFYKTVRATGEADGDGKLAIKVVVKEGNHVSWLAFKDVHYSEVTAPTEEHKTALAAAILAAEENTIGFDAGEYAPYTNIDARKALAAAKAIDVNESTDYEVVAATEALTAAVWDENEEEMNAVSDELFNGTEYGAAGWTRDVTWNNVSGGSYSIPAGTMTYGDVAYHEMPLEGNTVYKLTFGHRKWDKDNADNGGKVSVLNSNSEGLDLTAYAGTNEQSLQSGDYYFRTGEAGNYTFTVTAESGRLTFGNVIIKKATEADITLDENAEFTPTPNTYYQTLKLNRKFPTDKYVTMVLPFDMDEDATTDAFEEVYTLSAVVGSSIKLTGASEIEKGKPYIVKANHAALATSKIYSSDLASEVTNTVVKTEDEKTTITFVGTFAPIATVALGSYIVSKNNLYYVNSAVSLAAYRAYFTVETSEPGTEVKNFVLDFGDLATGINTVDNGLQQTANSQIYNLAGQRLNKAQKGVNIINGKKVLVK